MSGRILVVDDEEVLRLTLRTRLGSAGFEVHTAIDGEEALALLKENEFDIVLLDINMPVMDGITALGVFTELYPRLDVVMLTGFADFTTAIECLKSGAKDYLVKPIDPTELVTRMRAILRARSAELAFEKLKVYHTSVLLDDLLGSMMYTGRVIDHLLDAEGGKKTAAKAVLLNRVREMIIHVADRITRTVDSSDLGSKVICLYLDTHDIGRVVDESFERGKIFAESNGMKLVKTGKTFAAKVKVDEEKITFAIESLVMRAVEKSKKNAKLSIGMGKHPKDDNVIQVFVRSSASDEKPVRLRKILESLDGDEPTKLKEIKGDGLQLLLAQRYIESHGGGLRIEQDSDGGMLYEIYLPRESKGRRS